MPRDALDAVCSLLTIVATVTGAGLALVGADAAAHGYDDGRALVLAGLVLLMGGAGASVALAGGRP